MTGPIAERLVAAGLSPLPRTAWLAIDLDALRDNLAVVRDLAGPGVPVFPVVKADAYGHGALPIARALEAAGADGFCVAAIDEALALRGGGIQGPIRVLYPPPPGLAAVAARGRIGVSVGDATSLRSLLQEADGEGVDGAEPLDTGGPPLELELEIETGLGRGGVDPDAALDVVRRIRAAPRVRLAGLWTHLQAPEDAPRTASQLARFAAAVDTLRRAGLTVPDRHVAASAGLLTDVATLDGVRPGLAIYGLIPDEFDGRALDPAIVGRFRPVMSLHAQPVRVADLPGGHGIGYGPTFTTTRPSRIATLPLGYGDGYARGLSNRAEALVRGVRVPLVGNVAMDALMVDVTDVPGPPVTTDDPFVLMGRQGDQVISAMDLARLRTTNTWEVVTQMARRLPRVYDAASAPVEVRTLMAGRIQLPRIEIWNGDICDLEVDAIVNPANPSLWMATGVGGAIKRAGGDAIEFAAVRQAPVSLGASIVTTAGKLAAKAVIHSVSLDRDRRTSGPAIEAAVRSAMARAREIGATSLAFPALGTGVGGFPLAEAARITVQTVRDELDRSPLLDHVTFALRGAAAYEAFGIAIRQTSPTGDTAGVAR